MGAWGIKLYDSDAALDLKGDFEFWARLPMSAGDLVAAVTATDAGFTDADDEDHSDLWLALADQLHTFGLDHPDTFRRAGKVMARDLKVKAQLDMSASDLARRKAVLDGLAIKWAKPHPKPKKRRVLKEPERHVFPVGTVLVYPTDRGDPLSWYADWKADGWGTAIVLAQGHERGYFAWDAVGRLCAHGKARPTLQHCLKGAIETQPGDGDPQGKQTIALQIGRLGAQHVKRLGFEMLGKVELSQAKVKALKPSIAAPKPLPLHDMNQVFAWWTKSVWRKYEIRDPEIAVPRPAVPLERLRAG